MNIIGNDVLGSYFLFQNEKLIFFQNSFKKKRTSSLENIENNGLHV